MSIVEELCMKYPIIQAPMAGITTVDMVVASLDAGILGSIGAGYLSAEKTRDFIRQVKAQTNKPFMINLFAHEIPPVVKHEIAIARQALIDANIDDSVRRDEMKLSNPVFDDQLDIVIEEGVAACSFTFGLPTYSQLQQLKKNNIFTIATATTAEEVCAIDELGIDAICLQGQEAGGHRASFIEPLQYIPLDDLLKQAQAITTKSLIVAGGIATKQQIDHYIEMGVDAVMIGTLLIVSDESSAPSAHKKAILNASKDTTVITNVFSGKAARGISNSFIDKMRMLPTAPFPYQNDMTKGIRARAKAANNADNMSLWAGSSLFLCKGGSVATIIQHLLSE